MPELYDRDEAHLRSGRAPAMCNLLL